MTATQKIKRDILLLAIQDADLAHLATAEGITAETVDEVYSEFLETDAYGDYEGAFRRGQIETKLPCDGSRHYESKAVASKLSDGSWVGWTYWYGGGKHGEPSAVEWMEDAYDLDVSETEKLVIVREFKKK